MACWPLLGSPKTIGCVLLAAILRPACAVCWAEGCSVGAGGLSPLGGGTIARAAAARLATLRAASENGTTPAADGDADGTAGAGAAEPEGRGPPSEQEPQSAQDDDEMDCWALFADGEAQSKLAMAASEGSTGPWAADGAGTGVPVRMLRAEEIMERALHAARGGFRREALGASRALRLFHHAKWLAEHNHAKAAEVRFREASQEAAEYRRTVLAQHSLARLGYFLAHWGRQAQALEVLLESERFGALDPERDPVAQFLLGVLGRQAAGSDMGKLQEAEERILSADQQPTEELETQRQKLQFEIRYWRAAESSPRCCLDAHEVVHAVICLGSHLVRFVW